MIVYIKIKKIQKTNKNQTSQGKMYIKRPFFIIFFCI